eukprot:CAMPEP_0194135916 /NCGR_PEP_ID=MMETSP0152-20130528/5978_1 /TAXON_ID=1049557 /ORGANISM="Thalassiothrix antarctica, Strain L6-D1" /LENGTH=69 /DNA_ID=CAMNT_0038832361 /DNA_START=20 /DNA_END=226 /DNA_ORIENTATION=+
MARTRFICRGYQNGLGVVIDNKANQDKSQAKDIKNETKKSSSRIATTTISKDEDSKVRDKKQGLDVVID